MNKQCQNHETKNKNRRNKMKNIISILLVVVFATTIFAQPMPGKIQPPKENVVKFLKLTPEQEKKFDELNYNQRKADIELRSKIEKNRLELKKLIDDNNIDEKKILQLTDEISKLQAEMKSNHIKKWLDVYKMLDKDQQEKWIKYFQKMTEPGFMKNKIKERIKDRMHNFMMNRRMR